MFLVGRKKKRPTQHRAKERAVCDPARCDPHSPSEPRPPACAPRGGPGPVGSPGATCIEGGLGGKCCFSLEHPTLLGGRGMLFNLGGQGVPHDQRGCWPTENLSVFCGGCSPPSPLPTPKSTFWALLGLRPNVMVPHRAPATSRGLLRRSPFDRGGNKRQLCSVQTTLLNRDTGPGGLTSSSVPFSLSRCPPPTQGGGSSGSEDIFISLPGCPQGPKGLLPQVGLRGTWRQDAVGGTACAQCPDLITSLHGDPQWFRRTATPQKGLENKEALRKPPRTEMLCRDPEPPCDPRNLFLTFFFRHRGLDVSASRMEPLGRVSAQESGLARAAGAGHWNAIPVATQRRDPQT